MSAATWTYWCMVDRRQSLLAIPLPLVATQKKSFFCPSFFSSSLLSDARLAVNSTVNSKDNYKHAFWPSPPPLHPVLFTSVCSHSTQPRQSTRIAGYPSSKKIRSTLHWKPSTTSTNHFLQGRLQCWSSRKRIRWESAAQQTYLSQALLTARLLLRLQRDANFHIRRVRL